MAAIEGVLALRASRAAARNFIEGRFGRRPIVTLSIRAILLATGACVCASTCGVSERGKLQRWEEEASIGVTIPKGKFEGLER